MEGEPQEMFPLVASLLYAVRESVPGLLGLYTVIIHRIIEYNTVIIIQSEIIIHSDNNNTVLLIISKISDKMLLGPIMMNAMATGQVLAAA